MWVRTDGWEVFEEGITEIRDRAVRDLGRYTADRGDRDLLWSLLGSGEAVLQAIARRDVCDGVLRACRILRERGESFEQARAIIMTDLNDKVITMAQTRRAVGRSEGQHLATVSAIAELLAAIAWDRKPVWAPRYTDEPAGE